MVEVIYRRPSDPTFEARHVRVVPHREGMPHADKGYFYDSEDHDPGGMGSFDFRLPEAIERAKHFARERKISIVVVQPEPDKR